MIPETLYRGTSYSKLSVLTYPKAPNIDVLLSNRIFNFTFVDDPLSALLMGAEQAEKDNSPVAIVIAKDVRRAMRGSYEPNGTYKLSYHLDFKELKPSQLEILIEGKNLDKLTQFCDFLTLEKIEDSIKYTKRASKTLRERVPRSLESGVHLVSTRKSGFEDW